VPPTAPLDNLPHARVIVAVAYEEFEVVACHIWSGSIVFLVEHTVQLLHYFDVHHLQKVGLFHLDHVNTDAVGLGHGNAEVLEEFDHLRVVGLYFSLEEAQNYLIDLLNRLVNVALLQVLEGGQRGFGHRGCRVVLAQPLAHSVEVVKLRPIVHCLLVTAQL
jgi:hypothetical protein